jgi:hypothetical protein
VSYYRVLHREIGEIMNMGTLVNHFFRIFLCCLCSTTVLQTTSSTLEYLGVRSTSTGISNSRVVNVLFCVSTSGTTVLVVLPVV